MNLQENILLSRYTSLHVGGPARYLVETKTDEEVGEALLFAHEKKLPWFVIGKGSNTLFLDEGFPGLVIVMRGQNIRVEGTRLTAEAGVFMRPLVNISLKHGLRGLEELAGIPGTVGGAVRGNAGTWSTETKDVLVAVEVLDGEEVRNKKYEIRVLQNDECAFGYRDSIFKRRPHWIVLRATFDLRTGDPKEGQIIVARDLKDRHAKQPYDAPSAGSIFKNPDKANGIFSGKLIEEAGLKGLKVGGAEISEKHGNFILNRGGATSTDILTLIEKIQTTVKARSQVELVPEIQIVRP